MPRPSIDGGDSIHAQWCAGRVLGTLTSLLQVQADRDPGAAALEIGDSVLTYGELWSEATAFARGVLEACGPGDGRVGLCARRSLPAYVGYLGILLAGRSVVPMNPTLPTPRLLEVAGLSGMAVVAVDDAGLAHASALQDAGHPVLEWSDAMSSEGGGRREAAEVGDLRPSDECYLLFTSGSTGRPKGVPIRHGNAVSYVEHVIGRYELGPGCRASQTFELTFDPSVHDLFATWGSGATLVVPDDGEVLRPVDYVSDRDLTHWYSVPSVISLAHQAGELRRAGMPGLRFSLFSGEPLSFNQALLWQAAAPSARIANLYGPTEVTINCAEHVLGVDRATWPATPNNTVPIGEVYPHLEHLLVVDGVPREGEGELWVRGDQRFDGYLDPRDDDGTLVAGPPTNGDDAEPRAAVDGPEQWYRTGDRVTRQDGQLVHLGRVDDQVKVHGHRIEPGEVESWLRGSPGVVDAAVVVCPGLSGDELVAACTGDFDPSAVRARLRANLPHYLVPARVLALRALPVSANGKLDRRALSEELAPPSGTSG